MPTYVFICIMCIHLYISLYLYIYLYIRMHIFMHSCGAEGRGQPPGAAAPLSAHDPDHRVPGKPSTLNPKPLTQAGPSP